MIADRFVPVAEAVKAVGLKGEVKLYPLLDWYDPLLEAGYLVWDDDTPVTATGFRYKGACPVVQIAGAGDRNAAEKLIGRQLGFIRDRYPDPDFPKPEGGLPFRYLDREVQLTDGEYVGSVVEVMLCGSQLLLVVRGQDREVLIPVVDAILRPDPGMEGALVIDPPKGLLDVAGN